MTALAALTHNGTWAGSISPSVRRRTSPASSRARSKRFSGRAGSAGKSRYGASGSSPSWRRAWVRSIGAKRCRSTPHGSTATGRRVAQRGTSSASGSETAATRSMRRPPASVSARERGCVTSVPCTVTRRARAGTARAGHSLSPKWAWTMSNRDVIPGHRSSQCRHAPHVGHRPPGREGKDSDLGLAGAAQRLDLVTDEAAQRRSARGRVHVGDDQSAHRCRRAYPPAPPPPPALSEPAATAGSDTMVG